MTHGLSAVTKLHSNHEVHLLPAYRWANKLLHVRAYLRSLGWDMGRQESNRVCVRQGQSHSLLPNTAWTEQVLNKPLE